MDRGENTKGLESAIKPGMGQCCAPDPWAHRAEGMKCRTCMYYAPKGVGDKIGRCRRNAPTIKGFPVVFPFDWCGEHKIDENKI